MYALAEAAFSLVLFEAVGCAWAELAELGWPGFRVPLDGDAD